MPDRPVASIVIPTRGRPEYLDVALESIAGQASAAGAEIIVVNDGGGSKLAEVAARHGARVVDAPAPGGLNIARNAGIGASQADLFVLVDDDVQAPPGWLDALLAGVRDAPGADVFGGPIRARLEGGGPRSCGREGPPVTSLELGARDRDTDVVWGANMALRRRALELAGPFDDALSGRGDEEEWERAIRARGGVIRYVAGAGLDHRRTAADSRLSVLARAAHAQGRQARQFDERTHVAPGLAAELRTVAGCVWHVPRRRCLNGVVMTAHSLGRLREALRGSQPGRPREALRGSEPGGAVRDDFASGTSGHVAGPRASARALAADAACSLLSAATLSRQRLRRASKHGPRRRVLALAIEHDGGPTLLAQARAELKRSRHELEIHSKTVDGLGKFENLDALLAAHPADGHDWLLVLDDDIALPPGFLDQFLFLAERFGLALAQPAHRWRSHAAWSVTRRRPGSIVRETAFVEIGPLFALRSDTFQTLLPFPPLRFGWGLDTHWSAIAREHGWRQGVIDATPLRHDLRPVASSYDSGPALAEARAFLAERPYLPARAANRTLVTHRSW